jgi:VWFA-related protein
MRKILALGPVSLLLVLGSIALGMSGATLHASAPRRVTVAELEQTLVAALAQHRGDTDVAKQVAALDLSERLTDATLDRFAAKLPLQPHTALALQLLADQSAFLDPPPTEDPAAAIPDEAAQRQMLQAARAYAVQTWTGLPNFLVSRVTTRFDDGAQVLHKGEWPVRIGLHPIGTSTRQIAFRDGKEVAEQPADAALAKHESTEENGLRSWGEFGPALTVVLLDMAGRPAQFTHWETLSGRLAAVFHYEVPKEASHYAVTYTSLSQQVVGRTQFGYSGRDRSPQQVANIPRAVEQRTITETPAYHGTIALDPSNGAVLRITIEAELGHSAPLLRAATAVEYGPIIIGDRSFLCPTRSLALSVEPGDLSGCGGAKPMTLGGVGDDTAWQSRINRCDHTPVLLINETRFTNYHRFGSTARILTNESASGSTPANTPAPATAFANSSGVVPPAPVPPETGPPATDTTATAPLTSAPPPAATSGPAPAGTSAGEGASATPLPANPPVVPEISMTPTEALPDTPANGAPTPQGEFSLRITSRLVDVGLVAYDKKGHPVTDLKPEDLEIYDDGHKQNIRFFSRYGAAAQSAPASSESTNPQPSLETFSNRAPDPSPSPASPSPADTGATILLIDESHIAWPDMSNARSQMLKFLASVSPGEHVGLYTMNGLGFRVLVEATADHATLIARLQKFMPTAQSVSQAQDEETRNRQSFETVHNVADLNSVNGNRSDVPDAEQPVDPQLLTMGDNPARASLIILAQVARHLASLPGHKNLVWVSSDNVLADWQDQQVSIDKSPKEVASFALRAQEAMNEAHTAVYPFDVSQLEAGIIGADIRTRNVELTPAAADNAATAASAGGGGASPGNRNMQPGRITAEMNQNLHPIQGPVRELATATGGRTIRRSGDLAAELNGIVDDGRATYQLSFSPSGEADDRYHPIVIKLTGRRGLTLRYRTGYLFQREPSSLRERFQQAVWRPTDVSEIAVTADVVPMNQSASVKINIAGNDLGMEQQADRWMDKLDIFFIERDDAGLHAHLDGQTLGLRLKSATYQNVLAKGVPFDHAVAMPPGMGSLRVLVVDENSGRMGSVTIPALALRGHS